MDIDMDILNVLLVITIVWLVFYYIQKCRYMKYKDEQARQLSLVAKTAIMGIPTKVIKAGEEDKCSDCCAICIEAYKALDCVRVLPCKHEFHKNCIDPWLAEHFTCPMCKLDILIFYGYVVGDKIYSTPRQNHVPSNLELVDDAGNDFPLIELPSMEQQQQQQQQLPQFNVSRV